MIYNEHLLMESDDDCQIIANIVIGYDVRGNFVIQLGVYDDGWDYPEGFRYVPKKETTATIDVDDLEVMAVHLKLSKEDVLKHLLRKFGGSGYVARTSYVNDCFKEILELLVSAKKSFDRNDVDLIDVLGPFYAIFALQPPFIPIICRLSDKKVSFNYGLF